MSDGPYNQLHEVKPGDRVWVDAKARNIGDPRPIVGLFPVVGVYPQHAAGPCFYVQDEHGATAVLWQDCMTLGYIRDLPAAIAARDAQIAELRKEVERLKQFIASKYDADDPLAVLLASAHPDEKGTCKIHQSHLVAICERMQKFKADRDAAIASRNPPPGHVRLETGEGSQSNTWPGVGAERPAPGFFVFCEAHSQ